MCWLYEVWSYRYITRSGDLYSNPVNLQQLAASFCKWGTQDSSSHLFQSLSHKVIWNIPKLFLILAKVSSHAFYCLNQIFPSFIWRKTYILGLWAAKSNAAHIEININMSWHYAVLVATLRYVHEITLWGLNIQSTDLLTF